MENPKNKSAKSKKNKNKIKTEKKKEKNQNGKKHGKMDLSICICVAFILFSRLFFVFFVASILHLFCFSPEKKHTTCKIKAKTNRKNKIYKCKTNANGHLYIFSPCFIPSWRSFFPHLFATCQVRVVRFYQSCSSPPRLALLLFLLLFLASSSSSFSSTMSASTSALPTLRQAPCQLPSSVCTAGPQPGTFPAQCAPLDLNLGPSELSVHRWTSTWDLPSSVCTAGPQPGTFPAQCAPLDLNGQIEWQKICLPDRMSDRMPEDMPDRMPEDMPDRMP